jgi:hypothetical protein
MGVVAKPQKLVRALKLVGLPVRESPSRQVRRSKTAKARQSTEAAAVAAAFVTRGLCH